MARGLARPESVTLGVVPVPFEGGGEEREKEKEQSRAEKRETDKGKRKEEGRRKRGEKPESERREEIGETEPRRLVRIVDTIALGSSPYLVCFVISMVCKHNLPSCDH
jgi:hypothetical protein